MKKILDSIPWFILIVACLTLGLAPFTPPHFYEKTAMLLTGELQKPIDWFDFLMHGSPWFLLAAKAFFSFSSSK